MLLEIWMLSSRQLQWDSNSPAKSTILCLGPRLVSPHHSR